MRGGSLTGRIRISKRNLCLMERAGGKDAPSGPSISISNTKLSVMSSLPLWR